MTRRTALSSNHAEKLHATGTQGHKKDAFCALCVLLRSVRTSSLSFEHKTAEGRIRDAVLPDFNVTGKSIIKRVSSHRDDPVVPTKSLIQHGLDFKSLPGLEKLLGRVASVGILYADFGSIGSNIDDFQIDCTVTLLQVLGDDSKSSCAGADVALEIAGESVRPVNREIIG